jgi:hypothetical protein
VKDFSFHIEPTARFEESGQRISQSRLDLALQFRLPALKRTVAVAPKPQPASRKPPARFLNSEKEILTARQIPYGTFVISTMEQRDGSWIASFGCADGRPLVVDGRKQAVAITNAYPEEAHALAEALARIDAVSGA